ncbi:ABC transporter substrate-binding protein [Desulfococcaceae bacterium HSG7]|nr:ABC transporter substrate-binding protein [Desulfococcaceae bacterium HSG7]
MSDMFKLEKLAAAGKMTRREFISAAIAAGVSVSMAGTIFSSVAHAAPKKGGHFKCGTGAGSTTDSLDPGTTTHTYTQLVNHAAYNYMTEIDEKGQLVPELSTGWEPSKDAKTWTFKLRKGVTHHNGKTFDADDVIASINHHRGKDSKSAAKPIVKAIDTIKADGKNTVIFELSGGSADFPFLLSDYHLSILPAKDGKIAPTSGIGSGAYIIDKFDPGVATHFKRNPNYWKKGRGHFDTIEHLVIADVAARTNALTTGAIHAMSRCDLKTVHLLKRNKKVEVTQITGTQHYTLPMNATLAPFDNNDVRLALKYAIDREALVKTILRGYGEVGNDHPIGSSQPYYATLPQRQYDPDKAKFHLKKAGMDSLKVEIAAADAAFAGAVDTAVIYKEHAAKCGIELTVNRVPNDGYWSNTWMKKPWSMSYWGGRPTPDWMFSVAFAADAEWNEGFWKHEKFNKLLIEARAELDEAKRTQMYAEMQKIVSDEGSVLIPMYAAYVSALSKKIGHDANISADKDMDGTRAFERWWMA